MKKLIYTLLAVSINFSACEKDDNNSSNPFSGEWQGTYYGGEAGDWEGTVTSNGDVIGGIIRPNSGGFYLATGTVTNSGTFELVIGSVTSGAVFSGNATGNTVDGDWVNSLEGISGMWSGSKQ